MTCLLIVLSYCSVEILNDNFHKLKTPEMWKCQGCRYLSNWIGQSEVYQVINTGVLSNGKYLTTFRRIVVPLSSACLALVGLVRLWRHCDISKRLELFTSRYGVIYRKNWFFICDNLRPPFFRLRTYCLVLNSICQCLDCPVVYRVQ